MAIPVPGNSVSAVTTVPLWMTRSASGNRRLLQPLSRVQDRFEDLHVAAAAAQIACQVILDLVGRRIGIILEQGFGGEDEARRAVRALKGGVVHEGLLDWVQLLLAEGLHRDDLLAGRQRRQQQAGADRLAIDQHGAGAAHADTAALAHGEQLELAPQHVQQGVMRLDGDLLLPAVDVQSNELFHAGPWPRSARSTFSGVSGSSVMRTPQALYTALATHGITGGTEVSPIPWTSPTPEWDTADTVSLAGTSSNDGIM